jgi:hypothetical protein
MKLRRILAATVATALAAINLISITAAADTSSLDDELTDGTFVYELVDGGYKITDYKDNVIFDSIPSIRNGYAVVEIGEQALAGCDFLTTLTIPSSVKTIGDYAFATCENLTSITLPDTITSIPDGAFASCTSLTEITIPDNVTSIGMIAFEGCTSLETINLPEGLETIGEGAFEYCYSLSSLDIPSTVTEIGEQALLECPLQSITADNNSAYTVDGNVLYDKDQTTLYRAAVTGIDTNFYVPDTVSTIADGAFLDCEELEVLFLPTSVTKIGQEAFYYCISLRSIKFSEGLLEIDTSAFAQCTSLTSLSLPTTLRTIGEGAFYGASSLEKVVISDGLSTIDSGAFASCEALKSIIVPDSVSTIGDYALGYKLDSSSDSGFSVMDDFSMSVKSGSAAAKYAKSNDITYEVSDKNLGRLAFIVVCVGVLILAAVFALVLMKRSKKLAPASVRKAEALEKAENDPSYEKITDAKPESEETTPEQ